MGFMAEGNTLGWADASKHAEYIRQHGIQQLLHIYKQYKDRKNDKLQWGDEVEYIIAHIDEEHKHARVSLRAYEVLQVLMQEEKKNPDNVDTLWRPEYGRYMIEGTPGKPYSGVNQILEVEDNMRKRRTEVAKLLNPNERILTMTNFPRLGCAPTCCDPPSPYPPTGHVAESQYLPDSIINPHFRFATLTANIRERRGSNVTINVPLYKDTNTDPYIDAKLHAEAIRRYSKEHSNGTSHAHANGTPNSHANGTSHSHANGTSHSHANGTSHSHANGNSHAHANGNGVHHEGKEFNIHMDAMGFGMGCCCLQCTFQCCNISEARFFYDQLAVMAPIMLALTAATPVLKGLLADTDARWNIIAASVDDRTPAERGEVPGVKPIAKSRYDSISTYISPYPTLRPEYNDLDICTDEGTYNTLVEAGMDTVLARHFAHLFIRDPLVIYADRIELDDQKYSDHFENIQSTNWQTVRFKPPPPGSSIGWRVEFRSMEVQFSDFENAAFVTFAALLTRVISSFELNLYLPLSLVDKNMQTAHKRDAVNQEKFYFRKQITSDAEESEYGLFTINEIMNGNSEFKGIIPLMNVYLASANISKTTRDGITKYLSFISKRASGELETTATWIRKFVMAHPCYKHDSIVDEEIAYDLVRAGQDIADGARKEPTLLGNFV
jgi:glutamate--cysteine ligase catalytic subunit